MMENKSIGIVGSFSPWTTDGIATHSTELAKMLSKRNKVICVTTSSHKEELHKGNLKIYVEKADKHGKTLQKLKRCFLIRKDIDIFHMHDLRYGLYRFIDDKTPLVITCHGYPTLEAVANGRIKPNSIRFKFLRWVEKKAVERADAMIAVGSKLKKWIVSELGADEQKVFVIPSGVDSNKFKPFDASDRRKKMGYSSNDKVVVFVRAFTELTGIRYVVQSISIIHEKYPEVKLLAIGGGPLKKELEEWVKKKGLEEVIRFMDRIPNEKIPFYLNASDIFVSSSIPLFGVEETFGISLIEAMACSKPVIATEVGGLKETIEGGENVGVLIPPKNSEAIANAVIDLLDNPSKAKQMGENARKYVKSKYTWEKVVGEISKVYQCALDAHSKK